MPTKWEEARTGSVSALDWFRESEIKRECRPLCLLSLLLSHRSRPSTRCPVSTLLDLAGVLTLVSCGDVYAPPARMTDGRFAMLGVLGYVECSPASTPTPLSFS